MPPGGGMPPGQGMPASGYPAAVQGDPAAAHGYPSTPPTAAHGYPNAHPTAPQGNLGPAIAARPLAVAIACVLLWLYSAAMVAGGALVIIWAIGLERPAPWSTIMPFVGEMFVVLFIGGGVAVALAGAVVAAFAVAAFRGARAARWVLAVILTLGAIAALTGGLPLAADLPIAWTLLVAAALVVPVVLLFLPGSSAWLRDVAQQRSGPRRGHSGYQQPQPSHPGYQQPQPSHPGYQQPQPGTAQNSYPAHPGQIGRAPCRAK